jgi:small acid-soluble spore protein O (minor)
VKKHSLTIIEKIDLECKCFLFDWKTYVHEEVHLMAKRKSNHVIPGANAASSQGMGAGYNEEFSNEPLTELQKQNNKKRKKNQ